MGNNPSRSAAQPVHPHRSNTVSASSSPSHVPTRSSSTSSRKPAYRRNSLQSTTSAKHVVASPESRYRHDGSSSEARYTPQPRRESIAENFNEGYSTAAVRTRTDLLDDGASLKRFPSPSAVLQSSAGTATSSPGTLVDAPAGDGTEKRRTSMDSVSTIDEDEPSTADTRAVPTLVQWPGGGNKVYLTGTFCGWAKRYRMSKSSPGDVMSAVVMIPPGTHHVKFLVDGEMQTSQSATYVDLRHGRDRLLSELGPEAVQGEMRKLGDAADETGVLVNYLEVSADDMPPLKRQLSGDSNDDPATSHSTEQLAAMTTAEQPKHYTTEIPAYLRKLAGMYCDETEEDYRGSPFRENMPAPPSLPMMLQKVILNTSSQMKDDASVLTIPNHAVLNHLATSSIKNHVLAVSATTRYKKKYVTTILYKAAHD